MATKREWLHSKGLAKLGRGKFSNEAKAAITKAEAEGIVFDDATPTPKATTPKPAAPKAVTVKVETDDDLDIMFASELRYAGKRWFAKVNGKRVEVSEKAACGNCKYSLIGHTCHDPIALLPNGGGFVEVMPSG